MTTQFKHKTSRKIKFAALLLLILFAIPWSSTAQTEKKQITTGVITDTKGEPVVGASVIVKGTNIGTVTDTNGKYSIEASTDGVLLVKFLGFQDLEIHINKKKNILSTLLEDKKVLDEVIVVGYGSLSRKEVTSSITSMKNKDLIKGVATSPLMAISGKVAGLNISSDNGSDPNANTRLQLRGANSITGDMGPLVVVDGVPGGNINNIAPEDIESIDVLKDASAAAIYGTRASGGVILVTTKKGQEGRVDVTYTSEYSTQQITKRPDILTREQYLSAGFDGSVDYGGNTDWFDAITQTPFSQRQNLSMSGGTKNLKIYSSLNYRTMTGVLIGADREELSGRFNYSYTTLNDHLTISGHINYSDINLDRSSNLPGADDANKNNYAQTDGAWDLALKVNPTQPLYDSNNITGYNNWTNSNSSWNPVADIKTRTYLDHQRLFMGDVSFNYKIMEGFNTSLMLAQMSNTGAPVMWRSANNYQSLKNATKGSATLAYNENSSKTLNWITNYNKEVGNHSIKAMVGYSFQQIDGQNSYMTNGDFPVDGVKWYDMGSGSNLSDGLAKMGSHKNPQTRIIAGFGRVNYSYNEKYMMTASLRYEGSSKFAPGNRWGYFPALSGGWRISNENFLKNSKVVSNLMLRFGYGRTGNQGVPPGKTVRMYAADTWWVKDGQWFKTYGLDHNQNKDLRWETKDEYNLGIDAGFFKNRLIARVDIYNRQISNLIYEISVSAPPAVHDKTYENIGKMTDEGVEFEIGGTPIQRNNGFEWSTSLKASSNVNKLVTLDGNNSYLEPDGDAPNGSNFPAPGSPGSGVRISAGDRIGQFYLYKYAAISDGTSKYKYSDGSTIDAGHWMVYNKDGVVIPYYGKDGGTLATPDDKQYVGNAIPKVMLSWDNTITYKNFFVNIFFRSWLGQDVFNMPEMYYGMPADIKDQNGLNYAISKNKNIIDKKIPTDYYLENGSFLKLDAVTLGYTLKIPSIENYVKQIKVSFTTRNVFMLTNYSGVDPEVNINGLTPGFDGLSQYPRMSTYTLGLQVNF